METINKYIDLKVIHGGVWWSVFPRWPDQIRILSYMYSAFTDKVEH
jgi:hypothetical protein